MSPYAGLRLVEAIKVSMGLIENHTCIKFTNRVKTKQHYLLFKYGRIR